MRKLILTAILLLAGVFCFNSCDLDPEGSYTFTYICQYYIEDEDTATELNEYVGNILGEESSFVVSGRKSDASQQGLKKFQATLEKIDGDYMGVMLEDGEYYRLVFGILDGSAIEYLGYATWTNGNSSSDQ